MSEFAEILDFIRKLYKGSGPIALHAPYLSNREKEYLVECIDSGFVSSVGPFVQRFEDQLAAYCGSQTAVAIVNGTQALYLALLLAGVAPGTLVITQSFTFVATANAIAYAGASPAFVDIDRDTLGMSPFALEAFLEQRATRAPEGHVVENSTGRRISAVVPMHTFGHPCRIEEIARICSGYNLPLVEDAAEGLGSRRGSRHTGTFGLMGVFSFNGNKILTTGGGGAIVTDDAEIAARAKHLSTTAKVSHPYEFIHDQKGYNFRMPNLNAALGLAQLEVLEKLLTAHRDRAKDYMDFFNSIGDGPEFVCEPPGTRSNYWLNAIRFRDKGQKNRFLAAAVGKDIMARSAWRPMHKLDMYADAIRDNLVQTESAYEQIANLPSSVLGFDKAA